MGTFTNSEDPDEMPHFIRVYTVCEGKKDLQMKKYNFFCFNYNLTPPRYVQCTNPSILDQTRRKNPLVYKGLAFG